MTSADLRNLADNPTLCGDGMVDQLRAAAERIAELEAALQDKCHGFPETDYVPFCDGCDGYQREKFGKCRTDELQARIAELEREVSTLRLYGNDDCTAMADAAITASAPYGDWCRDRAACAGKGYCPLDPTCGD